MNGKVLMVGLIVMIVGGLGWYGNQEGSYLATGYNAGGGEAAPSASTFAVPLDAAYLILAIGIIVVIAGIVIKGRKQEAT